MYRADFSRILCAGVLFAVAAFGISLLSGSSPLGLGRALQALSGHGDSFTQMLLLTIRLPRTVAAFAIGALLALAGVLLQALFRNPLADPFVLGVSGGAAVGALSGMLLGAQMATQQGSALAGALAAGFVVHLLGRGGGVPRLLLCGVIVASTCGALITVLLALADTGQLRGMVFWLAGDLEWADHPYPLGLVALGALAATWPFSRLLNVLGAGELRSATVGLDTRFATPAVFLGAALLTALSVLSAGTIGFVGLIAPHLARLALRSSDHRGVAPLAMLLGGSLLCLADAASRTLAAPRQLPVGAVMALIGAPLFIVLLRRAGPVRA